MSDQNSSAQSGQAQAPNPAQSGQSDDTNPTGSGQAAHSSFTPLPDEQSTQSTGQPLAKVATQQIAISRESIEKFGISEDFAKKNPVLVDLILRTESMKDEERKYWFQLLPIMSEEQAQKLQNILQNEKDQLAELDKKYEAEVAKLNEKHNTSNSTWDPNAFTAKRKSIEEAEKAQQEDEKGDEADLLSQIENL